ncbi:MAG TPA: hypothetical protein VNB94_12055 [Mycobacteriales bacterium]|nr:hypothetical protein [Mycobacteriales bacterium]
MATATQAQMRTWARAKGMAVNERGSLSPKVVRAYAAAHTKKGTTVTRPARKKTTARAGGKATALPRARKAPAKSVRRPAAPAATAAASSAETKAPPAGKSDLAGGLRTYLGAIEMEVRAVSALSERIDVLVAQLNDVRDQQAKRLAVLDDLRASVADQGLRTFLDQLIKPRKTRVQEVVPKRLA